MLNKATIGIVNRIWDEFSHRMLLFEIRKDDLEFIIEKVPTLVYQVGEGLIGYWNSIFEKESMTIGPRTLGPRFESGSLTAKLSRTFFAPAPLSSETTIVVEKIGGSASASVELHVINQKGKSIFMKKRELDKGKNDDRVEIVIPKGKGGVAVVIIETDGATNKTEYRAKYIERPKIKDQSPISGFADLHIHQMAEYAFGGLWLHGSHKGPANNALKSCQNNFGTIPAWISAKAAQWSETDLYHGEGYPSFKNWPHHLDISHQQAHESWLKQAHEGGMNLIVACAVNNEPLSIILNVLDPGLQTEPIRDMPALKKQINLIKQFAKEHQWYAIAYDPWDARRIIHSGKMAVVISVECSNLFPENEGHFIAQLDEMYQMGVRCIQIAHEVDSRFAGAAPQEWILEVLQIVKNITLGNGFKGFERDSQGKNIHGLTADGRQLVKAIMDRHMILDIAHLSEKATSDVYKIAMKRRKYPLVNTHTKFKTILSNEEKKKHKEFVTTDNQIKMINDTKGIIGLRTAPWKNEQAKHGTRVNPVVTDSGDIGTSRSYAQQVAYAAFHDMNIAIGTDINGFTDQLGPRFHEGNKPPQISKEYWQNGLKHIGMLPELITDLSLLGTPGADRLANSAEKFCEVWERTWVR